jgi:hypothetical protein
MPELLVRWLSHDLFLLTRWHAGCLGLNLPLDLEGLGLPIKGLQNLEYVGSIPTRASSISPRYPCRIGFSTRVNGASRAE